MPFWINWNPTRNAFNVRLEQPYEVFSFKFSYYPDYAKKFENPVVSKLDTLFTNLIRLYGSLPFLLTCSAMIMSFDNYFYVVQSISVPLGLNCFSISTLHCIRFGMLLISTYEICRLNCLVCLIVVYFLIMVRDVCSILTSKIGGNINLGNFKELTSAYTSTFISSKYYTSFQELGTLVAIFLGMLLCAIANFVTVKGFNILPTPIYVVFPALSCNILVFVNAAMPHGNGVYIATAGFLKKCDFYAARKGGFAGKYMRCKLRGMRPFLFFTGFGNIKVFVYDKDVRMEYFDRVSSVTVTLLLGVPDFVVSMQTVF